MVLKILICLYLNETRQVSFLTKWWSMYLLSCFYLLNFNTICNTAFLFHSLFLCDWISTQQYVHSTKHNTDEDTVLNRVYCCSVFISWNPLQETKTNSEEGRREGKVRCEALCPTPSKRTSHLKGEAEEEDPLLFLLLMEVHCRFWHIRLWFQPEG